MLEKEWEDNRSTAHKHGRDIKLQWCVDNLVPYACEQCGRGPDELPMKAQRDFPDIQLTDEVNQVSQGETGYRLEVDHRDKDILNNDPANLQLLCNQCHKLSDMQTAKGVSRIKDPNGYAFDLLREMLDYDYDPNFEENDVVEMP